MAPTDTAYVTRDGRLIEQGQLRASEPLGEEPQQPQPQPAGEPQPQPVQAPPDQPQNPQQAG